MGAISLWRCEMPDVLIRDVDPSALARIDAAAQRTA